MKRYSIYLFTFSLIIFLFFGCASKVQDVTNPYLNSLEPPEITEEIQTANGKICGILNPEKSVELFAGIPFAKPPVGNLRWKEPENPDDWDGVFYADHFAPVSMQKQRTKFVNSIWNRATHSGGDATDFAPMSEDCLYLNVWRPVGIAEDEKLPVLVYIHGGSLTSGSSWSKSYKGETLAKRGIVFVTIAYRTGIFGYFAHEQLAQESPNHTTGNYGLLDQIKALEWVNKNIGYFGGDIENITIAGESAGSSSVNALCASPLAEGLFQKAIAESSGLVVQVPAHTFRSPESAFRVGDKIMKEYKADSIDDMRKIPAEKLLKSKHLNNAMTVDPYAMPEYPWEIYAKGQNHEEALLNGFNLLDGLAFTIFTHIGKSNYKKMLKESPYIKNVDGLINDYPVHSKVEAKLFYSDIFTSICFSYPHYNWSKIVTEQGKPVYEYCFSKMNRGIGSLHSGEIIYAYGNVPKNKYYDETDFLLENAMSSYWENFIKYGNPNGLNYVTGEKLPEWQTVAESGGKVLDLGDFITMIEDPFMKYYGYLDFDIDKEDRPLTFGTKEE